MAEKKVETKSYFKESDLFKDDSTNDTKKDASKDATKDATKGNEYEYKQDWGEQFDGLAHTCLCVLTLTPELKLKIIELPDKTLGKPFWIDNETIGFIAYQESPKRLGLKFCFNRVGFCEIHSIC